MPRRGTSRADVPARLVGPRADDYGTFLAVARRVPPRGTSSLTSARRKIRKRGRSSRCRVQRDPRHLENRRLSKAGNLFTSALNPPLGLAVSASGAVREEGKAARGCGSCAQNFLTFPLFRRKQYLRRSYGWKRFASRYQGGRRGRFSPDPLAALRFSVRFIRPSLNGPGKYVCREVYDYILPCPFRWPSAQPSIKLSNFHYASS